jgi:hypothetical protein
MKSSGCFYKLRLIAESYNLKLVLVGRGNRTGFLGGHRLLAADNLAGSCFSAQYFGAAFAAAISFSQLISHGIFASSTNYLSLFFDFHGLAAAFHGSGAAFGDNELGTAFGTTVPLSNFVCHSVPPYILKNPLINRNMSLTLVLIIEIIPLAVKAQSPPVGLEFDKIEDVALN